MFSDRVPLTKNSSKTGHYMGKFIADWGGSLEQHTANAIFLLLKQKNIRYKSNSQVYSQYFDL